MVNLYTTPLTHGSREDCFRQLKTSARLKALLEAAATHENRSLTNMLTTLLYSHCKKQGIKERSMTVSKALGGKHA